MIAAIDSARTAGDTLGGIFTVGPRACRSGSAATPTGTAGSTVDWHSL